MPATYEPIATTTLGSAAASITFSSIPATYTDLKVILTPISTGVSDYNLFYQFNNDTSTNYSRTRLSGNGTTAVSGTGTSLTYGLITYSKGFNPIPSLFSLDIFSYAGSTYKTQLSSSSVDMNGSGEVSRMVLLWRSTSAITSILFYTDASNNFAIGTTATLYGIKNA